jgi:hypothetical protein
VTAYVLASTAFISIGLALCRVVGAGLKLWQHLSRARVDHAQASAAVARHQLAAAKHRAARDRIERGG